MPSSPLQLKGIVKRDEPSTGFFNFIIGPMIRIKNRRMNDTLANDVDQEILSKNLKIEIKAREKIHTIMCCIGVFLASIISIPLSIV